MHLKIVVFIPQNCWHHRPMPKYTIIIIITNWIHQNSTISIWMVTMWTSGGEWPKSPLEIQPLVMVEAIDWLNGADGTDEAVEGAYECNTRGKRRAPQPKIIGWWGRCAPMLLMRKGDKIRQTMMSKSRSDWCSIREIKTNHSVCKNIS